MRNRQSSEMQITQISPSLAQALSIPGLTDLLVNGFDEAWVDAGAGMKRIEPIFESEAQLAEAARRLIAIGDRHLDLANPCADVALPGFRVHATLASGISNRTLLSIRAHRHESITLSQLAVEGFCTFQELNLLQSLLRNRSNLLIAGATGSGKTTLLRALLSTAQGERIVLLEDVAELAPIPGHVISLQTRQANVEGRGEITLDRLLREALRMRPDRLVVGEVRGAELTVLLQALNTGHSGATTIHANSLQAVAGRLVGIGQTQGLTAETTALLATTAFDTVIQLGFENGRRKLVGIGRLQLNAAGALQVVETPNASTQQELKVA